MKMKMKWTSNWALKIGSILFALILWLFVSNINDPIETRILTDIQVELLNTDKIADLDQVYNVLDNSDVVNVTVRAPKSIVNSFNKSNIVAVADVNELSSLNTITIQLSTNINENLVESIKGSHESVKLNIEEKKSKQLMIKCITSGTVVDGYKVGNAVLEQNLVRIEGPASEIDEINRAVVDVNVTDFTSDIGTDVAIKLYDIDGNEKKSPRINKNISTVRVNVSILQTKQVPIRYETMGTPATGYRKTGEITSIPESVLLAGKSSVISDVTAIIIPAENLDITGYSENYKKTINISEYLPDNIDFAEESFNGDVQVTVMIEPEVAKSVAVRENNIQVINLPEGFEAELMDMEEVFRLNLIGLAADLEQVNTVTLAGTIDIISLMEEHGMTELAAGYYTEEVVFNLSDNITVLENMEVTLHIRKTDE